MPSRGHSAGILNITELLKIYGFNPTAPTKLVRHQDIRLPELRRNGWLDLYQAYQSRARFHDVEQIVSFYGLPGTRAGFYGVYRVVSHRPASQGSGSPTCPWVDEWKRECRYFYELERDPKFDELRDRLVIEWGKATISWVQRLVNKPVVQILEAGRQLPPFDDYLEFSLTHDELRNLFRNEEAHSDWRAHLSAVGGIYLILDEGSGDLYIGSAHGQEGIWGRWRDYAASGHGGNNRLRRLVDSRPDEYPRRFRFSILQILPKTMMHQLVVSRETLYKEKLGSRVFGLNDN